MSQIDLDELEREHAVYGNPVTNREVRAVIAELRAARELIEACAEIASVRGDSDATSRWLNTAFGGTEFSRNALAAYEEALK